MSVELRNQIYNMDCISGMADAKSETVDLIVTDPPFAIDFKAQRGNYNRTGSRVLEGYGEVPEREYAQFSMEWITQAHRILKSSGSMYVFSGWNNLKDILVALDEVGFTTVNHIIWKYQFGVVTKRKFVTSHYHCIFVCKDDAKRRFNQNARFDGHERNKNGGSERYRDMEDVWEIKREYWIGDVKTPTKLPAEIIRKIIAYSSDPGDLVVDPFLGSGQTAVVARLEGRDYGGFEIVPAYYGFIRERLESGNYRIDAEEASKIEVESQPSLPI